MQHRAQIWTLVCIVSSLYIAGCTHHTTIPYLRQPLHIEAPPLPKLCQSSRRLQEHWVVFTSEFCTPCRTWVRRLESQRNTLHAQGISIEIYVQGTNNCTNAAKGAHSTHYPFAPAPDRTEHAWAASSTPTTYRVRDGVVVERIVGVPPLGDVLSGGNTDDARLRFRINSPASR